MRDQRARDRHALLLPARQFLRHPFAKTDESHVFERRSDLRCDLALGCLRHAERKRDVALHRHVRKERVALKYRAHRPCLRRLAGEVFAIQKDSAAIGRIEPRNHPQERCLAAARRPEQCKEFAGLDRKADVVDGSEIAETAGDALDLEQRHRGRWLPLVRRMVTKGPTRRPRVRRRVL